MAAGNRQLAARLLLCLVALAGCVQDDGTRFNPIRDLTSVSDDDERQLGMDFDRELQKHVRVIYDPVVAGYLNDLGQKIVRQIEPQPFIYRFRVIDDPSLNAFAVPGGYVYFHSGTLLAAGSEGELAGVMGHEIAHVKARHYARMQKASQLPDILAGIAGMAAAVATGEPGILVATQAANVAMKLHFSREYETEADELGTIFMTRAGFPPAAITRFFERILAEQRATPDRIPPYLFTHPDVQDRIAAVTAQAEKLHPVTPAGENAPSDDAALREVQMRLAQLIDARRPTLPGPPSPDPALTDPLLAEAERLAAAGQQDAALLQLARAEASEPNDPRVPFRVGELLAEQGRHAEAAEAYRRTVRLDPTRALVFFKLGLAYRQIGERHRAVYAFEQASLRAGPGNVLQRRSDWEVEKLTFAIVPESGVAAGDPLDSDQRPVPQPGASFAAGTPRIGWWARLGSRFVPYSDQIRVRWLAPDGRVVQDEKAERPRRPYVGSVLEFDAGGAAPAGTWTVEASIDDDVIDSQQFEVR
jgi:beta-barrel assembly-enhancing protease